MGIEDQLSDVRAQVQAAVKAVDDLASVVEEMNVEGVSHSGLSSAASNDPAVQQAAVALAKAIARAEGYGDLPVQVGEGDFGQLPVMVLPEELQKYGGIGIGVMIAPPTDAARRA